MNQEKNIIENALRHIKTKEGHDAFSLYQQGSISKGKLVELIACELIGKGLVSAS